MEELKKMLRENESARSYINVVLILEKGANINGTDNNGLTAHMFHEKGDTKTVELFLEKEPNIGPKSSFDATALHWAARNTDTKTVLILLGKGANIDEPDENGQTPLYWSAKNGQWEIVNYLLENGANINGANINGTDNDGRTALHWAAEKGDTETVKLLLENGANINAQDNDRRTALMAAAIRGNTKTVELLLATGANIDEPNKNGWTALHWAARNTDTKTVLILLEKGANIDLKEGKGRTALHWAAEKGNTKTVELLLEKGANINAQDNGGITALMFAAIRGNTKTVELLLENGANVGLKVGNGLNLVVAKKGDTETVALLLANGADINGADINGTDNNGRTTLHWAAAKGHTETVKLLIENGANINGADNNGRTALMFAAAKGNTKTVELLLEKGANIDEPDENGRTALYWSAKNGQWNIFSILLDKGAKVNQANEYSQTASVVEKFRNTNNLIKKYKSLIEEKYDEKNIIKLLVGFENELKLTWESPITNEDYFKKDLFDSLKFEEENNLLVIAVRYNMKDLAKYLVDKLPIDKVIIDSAWEESCLLLNPEIAFDIKKPEQLTDEDKKFLEEHVNLSTQDFGPNKTAEDIESSKNRVRILLNYKIHKGVLQAVSSSRVYQPSTINEQQLSDIRNLKKAASRLLKASKAVNSNDFTSAIKILDFRISDNIIASTLNYVLADFFKCKQRHLPQKKATGFEQDIVELNINYLNLLTETAKKSEGKKSEGKKILTDIVTKLLRSPAHSKTSLFVSEDEFHYAYYRMILFGKFQEPILTSAFGNLLSVLNDRFHTENINNKSLKKIIKNYEEKIQKLPTEVQYSYDNSSVLPKIQEYFFKLQKTTENILKEPKQSDNTKVKVPTGMNDYQKLQFINSISSKDLQEASSSTASQPSTIINQQALNPWAINEKPATGKTSYLSFAEEGVKKKWWKNPNSQIGEMANLNSSVKKPTETEKKATETEKNENNYKLMKRKDKGCSMS